MGSCLHAGHLSLVSAARAECDIVAASIFVNPTQFGPPAKTTNPTRATSTKIVSKLESAGVHALFAPSAADMYPPGQHHLRRPRRHRHAPRRSLLPRSHFRGVRHHRRPPSSTSSQPDRALFQPEGRGAARRPSPHRQRSQPLPVYIAALAPSSASSMASPSVPATATSRPTIAHRAPSSSPARSTAAQPLAATRRNQRRSSPRRHPQRPPQSGPDPILNAVPTRLDYAAIVDPRYPPCPSQTYPTALPHRR